MLENLLQDLRAIGFGTDDEVPGSDAVDVICLRWGQMNAAIAQARGVTA